MTGSTSPRHMPGTIILNIARLLFRQGLMSAVVEPTIADLQSEVAAAGSSRVKRIRAKWRGYRAFWTVALVVPFVSWPAPTAKEDAVALPGFVGHVAVGSIVVTLLAAVGPVFGAWVVIVMAAGALLAILIHAWYERHPSDIPTPSEPLWRLPQINFSSTDIAGNVGGLIFAVGSVLIVSLGLPSVFWFLLAATIFGCFLAWGLVSWHTRHPKWRLPENRIVLR